MVVISQPTPDHETPKLARRERAARQVRKLNQSYDSQLRPKTSRMIYKRRQKGPEKHFMYPNKKIWSEVHLSQKPLNICLWKFMDCDKIFAVLRISIRFLPLWSVCNGTSSICNSLINQSVMNYGSKSLVTRKPFILWLEKESNLFVLNRLLSFSLQQHKHYIWTFCSTTVSPVNIWSQTFSQSRTNRSWSVSGLLSRDRKHSCPVFFLRCYITASECHHRKVTFDMTDVSPGHIFTLKSTIHRILYC